MTHTSVARPATGASCRCRPTKLQLAHDAPGSIEPGPDPDPDPQFDALVREHGHAVLLHAVRMTSGDRSWAEDVVQETMIRAWHRLDRMTEEHGSVRSWLLRVAHNLVVDGYRARHRTEVELDAERPDDRTAPDGTDQVLTALVVEQALATLSADQRVVLEQIYLHDLSLADVSRALEVPVGTVKSRAFYALRRLRSSLIVGDSRRVGA